MPLMKPAFFENYDIQHLNAYAESTILSAFNNIKEILEEEYNYPQGGCQQRAHISSLLLEKKYKIKHAKIWLFAAGTLAANNTTMFEIKDSKHFAPGNKIQWGYHVAPVVKMHRHKKVDVYVMDPALNKNKPMLLNAWFKAITNSETGSYTYTSPATYFFNCYSNSDGSLSTSFDGTFYEYSKESRQNLELEKGIAICSTAMHIFHNHIEGNRRNNKSKKKLNDLKAMFGNATAIDCLIAQNSSANTPNTTARYAITHHGDVLNEAKMFFNDKLIYWAGLTNSLLKR